MAQESNPPMPPEYYVGALHDTIHVEVGRTRLVKAVKARRLPMESSEELSIKEETFKVVQAPDLNLFVEDIYGKRFSFNMDMNADAGAYYEFQVKNKELLDDVQSRLDDFIETGSHCCLTQVILIDLCRRGLIEPGVYLIEN